MKKLLSEGTIIQIDVTNACVNACSNCTRFIGHHKKSFFMDLGTYKKAVDSLAGYSGIIGMIGGEPLLHPDFAAMAGYIKKTVADKSRRGLWSTVPTTKYNDIINDTFGALYLNDHSNSHVLHAPMLVAISEIVSDKKKMWESIDNCWVYENWSPSITPKGAFFCEVAAALDMLFDGPGGWPLEPDWWRRTPQDYGDQKRRWCRLCGGSLALKRRPSAEERDDVSEGNNRRLLRLGSPRAARGGTILWTSGHKPGGWTPHSNCYMDEMPNEADYRKRIRNKLKQGASPSSVSPSLLVVDPGMIQTGGHHFDLNLSIQKTFQEKGVAHEIVTSRVIACNDLLLNEFSHIRPVLDYLYYDSTELDPLCGKLEAFFIKSKQFFTNLTRALSERIERNVYILMHTADAPAIYGMALWYKSLPEKRRPHVILCTHAIDSADSLETALYALAFKNFADEGRVRLFASNRTVADAITPLAYGKQGQWLPFPLAPALRKEKNAGGQILFGLTGNLRSDKDMDILAPSILRYIKNGGSGNFHIAVSLVDNPCVISLVKVLQSLAARYPDRIRLFLGTLIGEVYQSFLASLDALILLHNPKRYKSRSSKVFVDAVTSGVAVLYASGGDIDYEAQNIDCASVIMEELSIESLTDALFTYERNAAYFRKKAECAAESYRLFHSPENFYNIIFEQPGAIMDPFALARQGKSASPPPAASK